uniref:PHD-type domain-containing protein n=1 Tax=Magallana gigas TaxID=29159 RepID=A0A8W8NTC5_MAGGI
MSDESAECVVCDAAVRRLQQGLQCDTCNRWQHRTCNSGITQEEYRRLRYEDNFEWHCVNCSGQQTNEPQDTSEDTYQIGDAVVDEATFHVTLDSVTSTGGGASNTDSVLEPDAHSTRILDENEEMDVDVSFDVSGGMDNDEPIEERYAYKCL